MTPSPHSSAPRETASYLAARRLMARELDGRGDAKVPGTSVVVAAAEAILHRLHASLTRSFGAYGSVTLIARALTRAKTTSPLLERVTAAMPSSVDRSLPGRGALHVDGLAAAASGKDAPAVHAAVTSWLAQIMDLLGELIGDALARAMLDEDQANGAAGADADAYPMADEP